MTKRRILIQLDPDRHDHLLQYSGVSPDTVASLVHGAIFTRGPADLHSTAIFIGGSNVDAGERLLEQVRKCFFGPMRVSVLFDANGANTTAAAAVLAAAKHLDLKTTTATVLAGTGPVGQRAARLLAGQGAEVRVASRSLDKATAVCEAIRQRIPDAKLSAMQTSSVKETEAALQGTQLVISAGATGVELLSAETRDAAKDLMVAIDLNAVPPLGISGIQPLDKGARQGDLICYGALGVGGTKMKIHRAAIERLFTANKLVLDAEEVLAIGEMLAK
jgi:methylenetetrahydrofolate/methylenetetrahydromethanopterin dehydrogenase (NADP+)